MKRTALGLAVLLACMCLESPARGDAPQACPDDGLAQKRAEIRAQLEELIRQSADPAERAVLFLRLAESLEQQARACPQAAARLRARAADACRRALDERGAPRDRLDEARYRLGLIMAELKQTEQAMAAMQALAEREGAYSDEAALFVAEHDFDAARLDRAVPLYSRLCEGGGTLATYACYKLAWCHYNLTAFDRALSLFDRTLRMAAEQKNHPLAREARRDYVLAFAMAGTPARAGQAFRDIDPGRAREMRAQLAGIWEQQGRYADAVAVRESLIADAPEPLDAAEQLLAVLRSEALMGQRERVIGTAGRLAERLAAVPVHSRGRRRARLLRLRERAEQALCELAAVWFKETPFASPEARRTALALLELCLRTFPGSARASELRLCAAELHLRAGRVETAALTYERALADLLGSERAGAPAGRLLCAAAHGAMLARYRLLEAMPGSLVPMLDAAEIYLRRCERDAAGRCEARAAMAKALLALAHHGEAAELIDAIAADCSADDARALRQRIRKSATKERLRFGRPAVTRGPISPGAVREVLFGARRALAGCLPPEPVQVEARFRLAVAANGRVAYVRAIETRGLDERTIGCMKRILLRLRLPAPASDAVVEIAIRAGRATSW
ncbi:MAG: hypothetical protein JXR96_10170 [Deltaproteobacteria bacterium]|nr:hypothetical protein [Deltaproteobacteria bacterium]